jgi:hypothetical protein
MSEYLSKGDTKEDLCIAIIAFLEFVGKDLPIFAMVDYVGNVNMSLSHFDEPALSFKFKHNCNNGFLIASTLTIIGHTPALLKVCLKNYLLILNRFTLGNESLCGISNQVSFEIREEWIGASF